MKHFLFLFLPLWASAQLTSHPLPKALNESSGLEWATDSTLYTMNDSGNRPILYEITLSGTILRETDLAPFGVKNVDIESLAADALYLYICDVGNNYNERKDLVIYRLSKAQLRRGWGKAEKIYFTPAEQRAFPPGPRGLQYDFEGVYADHESLVLFSKNRTEPLNFYTRLYRVPKTPGHHRVACVDSIRLSGINRAQNWITAADQFSKKQPIVLLSGPMVHLLYRTPRGQYMDVPFFIHPAQKEALVMGPRGAVFITDEYSAESDGNLYSGNLSYFFDGYAELLREPAKLLNASVVNGESAVVKINYMSNPDITVRVLNPAGEEVAQSKLAVEYYPRKFGEPENIIQSRTLSIPVSGWPTGTYTVLVDHPVEALRLTLTVRS